jgi:hypothetical protein
MFPRPVSAYALFFRDTQAAIKGQNPNASFGEVSKIVASMWDALDAEHKNVSTILYFNIHSNFLLFFALVSTRLFNFVLSMIKMSFVCVQSRILVIMQECSGSMDSDKILYFWSLLKYTSSLKL